MLRTDGEGIAVMGEPELLYDPSDCAHMSVFSFDCYPPLLSCVDCGERLSG